MRFTVVWTQDALNQLAGVWNRATDRAAVTAAAHQVDVLLQNDPDTQGMDFYGDRYLIVPPLQIVFAVRPDDMTIEVQLVW
jgi:hypothetical protein